MASLSLAMLGSFQAMLNGMSIPGFATDKAQALLAYLAIEADRPHRREFLAGLLWPDRPEPNARQSLSQALYTIRRTLGEQTSTAPLLAVTARMIQFAPGCDYWIDVHAFTNSLARREAHNHPSLASCEVCLTQLVQAVSLYRGEFLAGFSIKDSAPFEEWLILKREQFHCQCLVAYGQLAEVYEQRHEWDQALGFAQRQLALEPWQEETHQRLMRLFAWKGRRNEAIAQYESCQRLLAQELGVEPSAETMHLYEQIRVNQLKTPAGPPPSPVEDSDTSILPTPTTWRSREEWSMFVNCDDELAQLADGLAEVLTGRGRVMFITGEAGQGKTALVQEFCRQALQRYPALVVAGGNCNAYTGLGDPYLPFREILSILTGETAAEVAAARYPFLTRHQQPIQSYAIEMLLTVAPGLVNTFVAAKRLWQEAPTVHVDAQWQEQLREFAEHRPVRTDPNGLQQAALFQQYGDLLQRLAVRQPLLLIVDDLQWADAGTLSLLFYLGRQLQASRILIVGLYRPTDVALGRDGQRHPLEPVVHEFQRHFGPVTIDLQQRTSQGLVDALLDRWSNRLEPAFRQTLHAHTGGNPLFTIELLRSMQEQGDLILDAAGSWVAAATLDWNRLPARVEAVIGEQIKRLPLELQQILTLAAVQGEHFVAEVIACLIHCQERTLVQQLSGELERQHRLVCSQGVHQLGERRWSLYQFRHILFQKYLYHQLDAAERAYLHGDVGDALEALYASQPAEMERRAGQLAWHFQEAGNAYKAVAYRLQAGRYALRLAAPAEAIPHLLQGLACLSQLGGSAESDQQELALQSALGVAFVMTQGYAAPEVERHFRRAEELCRQQSDAPALFPVLRGLTAFYRLRGDLYASLKLAKQLLSLAQKLQEPQMRAEAHSNLGATLKWIGDFRLAHEHLQTGSDLYTVHQEWSGTHLYGQDSGVHDLTYLATVLWALGYIDQGLLKTQEALRLAQQIGHPHTLAYAHHFAAHQYQLRRQGRQVLSYAQKTLALAEQYEFPFWRAAATVFKGWALVAAGRHSEGIECLQEGLVAREKGGMKLGKSFVLGFLAEAYGQGGQVTQGLAAVNEALSLAGEGGECWRNAELWRLKGELLLAQRGGKARIPAVEVDEVEACFHQAIDIARRQQAKSWELRAAMSLCRLWQAHSKQEEAYNRLAEIYAWFTDGFDTPDLQEASALLTAPL